ncbi:MAG: hypothetical protein ACOC53_03160 [Candidatus Saliniplasma sp.]
MFNIETKLLLTTALLVTYIIGILIFKPLLKKLKKEGFTGRDMYKLGYPSVPEMGGIGIAFTYLTGLLFLSSFHDIPSISYIVTFVLILYFFFGLVDDIVGVGGAFKFTHSEVVKILIPLFFAFPLIRYVDTSLKIPLLGTFEFGIVYMIVLMPVFIMVSSNLINMFSYYNGQSAGTTLIVLSFLALRLIETGKTDILFFLFPFMGATLSFLSYNIHPAGVFPGDCGDMMMGAMIGIVAILGNLEFYIFVCLLPLTINFLMVAFWFLSERGEDHKKFGKVDDNGNIDPPNAKALMWLFPALWPMDERKTTIIMYTLVFLSSLAAWIIF